MHPNSWLAIFLRGSIKEAIKTDVIHPSDNVPQKGDLVRISDTIYRVEGRIFDYEQRMVILEIQDLRPDYRYDSLVDSAERLYPKAFGAVDGK